MTTPDGRRDAASMDSESGWLGEVPSQWNLRRVKDFAQILSGYTPEQVNPDYQGITPYYKVDDLNSLSPSSYISANTWFTDSEIPAYPANILLLPKRGMSILNNRVGITSVDAIFDTNLMGLCLNSVCVDVKFVFYWISAIGLSRFADVTTIPQLNNKHIYPLAIYLPALPEQQAIADYLDAKTAQIDRKIDLLTRKAAKYRQLKQALINAAVTRGLDQSVPMKDSGVEWIGEVPAHWDVARIKDRGIVHGRVGWKALKASEYVDDGYIFLSTPNIKGREIDFVDVNYITHERYVESPEIALRENDILLAKDGSTLGTANIISVLPRPATVNSSIAVLRFDDTICNRYVYYQIISDFIQNRIGLKKSGMGVPHLFQRDINDFFILLPPMPEQKAVVEYLDAKVAKIDQIVDAINRHTVRLQDLRKALINAAVTGKLRVT